jgi:hypothetical protein
MISYYDLEYFALMALYVGSPRMNVLVASEILIWISLLSLPAQAT